MLELKKSEVKKILKVVYSMELNFPQIVNAIIIKDTPVFQDQEIIIQGTYGGKNKVITIPFVIMKKDRRRSFVGAFYDGEYLYNCSTKICQRISF